LTHSPRRRALAIGFIAAIAGCGGTHPIDVAAQPHIQPDKMVEFKYRGTKVQLDSVIVARDSISGIPWHEPALCCKRVAYALSNISKPGIRTFPTLGVILGVTLAVIVWFVSQVPST
jgi:hypothetical protein